MLWKNRNKRVGLCVTLVASLALLFCSIRQAQAMLPVTDGLVGYWPGEGNASDESDNGMDGSLINGVEFATGVVGQAFSFDGVDDYVELPTGVAIATQQDITMSAWIKLGGGKANSEVFRRGSDCPGEDFYGATLYHRYDQIGLAVVVPNPGGGYPWVMRSISYPLQIASERWHHVVGVRSGTIIEIWLDGMSVSWDMSISGPLRGTGRSAIGYALGTGPELYFDGLIDEVAVYDRALSVSEVLAIFRAPTTGAAVEQISILLYDVMDLNLQHGIENSLDAKLDAAFDALDDLNENNDVAAINSLQAFINAVEAQRGNHIPEADADALITDAQNIIELLSS